MNDTAVRDELREFISLIESNRIKLVTLNSKTNENLSGVLAGNKIERNVEFQLKSIGTGEQNGNDLIIFGEYEIEIEDKMEDISLISLSANYKLILTIMENDNYNNNLTDDQQKTISLFFNQSGRLILFPYVRHLYDMIAREADFFMPPIPPIVFRK